MAVVKLDLKDKRIIKSLENDARKPFSQVAKEVGLSRESVAYRYRRLCEEGIVSGSYALINPARFGLSIFRVLFRLGSLEEEQTKELIDYFNKEKKVMWFASVGGRWDLIVEFLFSNAFEFNEELAKTLSQFKDFIQSYEVSIVLSIKFYNSAYLLKSDGIQRTVREIGGRIDSAKLSEIDYKILELIKNNARLTNVVLSEKLGVSRNTVNSRIKFLLDKGIVLGFHLFLNPAKLGLQSYKLLLSLKSLDLETEKRLFSFAESNEEIVYAHKNFGKRNAEFEVVVKNALEVQNLSIKLRTLFEQDLTDLELLPIFKDYKINLLP